MPNSEKLEFITRLIAESTKREVVLTREDRLVDLGLDSLDVVEVQLALEDKYNVDIPDNALIVTIGDLLNLLNTL